MIDIKNLLHPPKRPLELYWEQEFDRAWKLAALPKYRNKLLFICKLMTIEHLWLTPNNWTDNANNND